MSGSLFGKPEHTDRNGLPQMPRLDPLPVEESFTFVVLHLEIWHQSSPRASGLKCIPHERYSGPCIFIATGIFVEYGFISF